MDTKDTVVEEAVKEFNDRLWTNTLGYDAWFHLSVEKNCTCHIDDNEMVDWLKSALERAWEAGINKAIEVSDIVEAQSDTSMGEWRAFKRLRNTLRDLLTKPTKETG